MKRPPRKTTADSAWKAFPPRTGWTLIELLTTLGILTLLIALLVPAVQASREAARKTECCNHLRQIGIALHNFESRHKTFPMEGGPLLNVSHSSRPWPGGFSVQAQLLPDLDQTALAKEIDLTKPLTGGQDREKKVAVFQCPSDPGRSKGISYRVCQGTQVRNGREGEPGRGLFRSKALGSRDVLDGSSQTIAVSERSRSDDAPAAFQPFVDVLGSGADTLFEGQVPPDEMLAVCRSLGNTPALGYSGEVGWFWYRQNVLQTHYNHVAPPNSRITDCALDELTVPGEPGTGNRSNAGAQLSARSHHPGGVHSLFVDGSVRFVNESINLSVWRALSTIADADAGSEF